ncbi:MAG: MBOAT family protein [Gammaproteobacteria bacterium]|nr:MBOAT family protein [Gammaproteobacteria bacterium]
MLFNSFEFLFCFLPVVLFLFHIAHSRYSDIAAIKVLVCASLFFYGWWQPVYLLLLLSSIFLNFYLAKQIHRLRSKAITVFAVCLNLASILYYKYAGFLISSYSQLTGQDWHIEQILLPLAISFFTFQQIAYLVDVYRKGAIEESLLNYTLFVSFFPQLIAGPIVHHSSMMPQFSNSRLGIKSVNVAIGLSIFSIGFFKKTVLADGVAVYANLLFQQVDKGPVQPDFFQAWGGALAYTCQLYFDFSGYSDMAIGLGLLFGIALPLNFNSPYKALSITDFWRRWHMTLSQFLRDYLYIALGGNRLGNIRRYVNLFLTMLLGGLWHGAGWNFLIWGALHGFYLIINHGFSSIKHKLPLQFPSWLSRPLSWLLCFLAVVVGWVFFRASTLDGALTVLSGMAGLNGISLPAGIMAHLHFAKPLFEFAGITSNLNGGSVLIQTWLWSCSLIFIALVFPNVHDLFRHVLHAESKIKVSNSSNSVWNWQPTKRWAFLMAVMLLVGISTLGQISEFLYFNF